MYSSKYINIPLHLSEPVSEHPEGSEYKDNDGVFGGGGLSRKSSICPSGEGNYPSKRSNNNGGSSNMSSNINNSNTITNLKLVSHAGTGQPFSLNSNNLHANNINIKNMNNKGNNNTNNAIQRQDSDNYSWSSLFSMNSVDEFTPLPMNVANFVNSKIHNNNSNYGNTTSTSINNSSNNTISNTDDTIKDNKNDGNSSSNKNITNQINANNVNTDINNKDSSSNSDNGNNSSNSSSCCSSSSSGNKINEESAKVKSECTKRGIAEMAISNETLIDKNNGNSNGNDNKNNKIKRQKLPLSYLSSSSNNTTSGTYQINDQDIHNNINSSSKNANNIISNNDMFSDNVILPSTDYLPPHRSQLTFHNSILVPPIETQFGNKLTGVSMLLYICICIC